MESGTETASLWLLDSEREPLAGCLDDLDRLGDTLYVSAREPLPDWGTHPDVIIVSGEIAGGPGGENFARLVEDAGFIPVIVAARLRSLTQALAFFRNGAADYLTLPLDVDEAKERVAAAIKKSVARAAMAEVVVELAPEESESREEPGEPEAADDILAGLCPAAPAVAADAPEEEPAGEAGEEPEAVDGLFIPTLWEELPCGLMVFDSGMNLVFTNALALELFGKASMAELQDALERDRASFAAYGQNHNPLADNQWPHLLAQKTRAPRSAVLSLERQDRRRVWLRIDCLPHLTDGKVSRLSMTAVNLTGELPPLVLPEAAPPVAGKRGKGKGKARGKKGK